MTSQSEIERDKAVVDAFYQAGIEGHLTIFARYLDPDFKVTAPNYLTWVAHIRAHHSFEMKYCPTSPMCSTSRASATTALSRRADAYPR